MAENNAGGQCRADFLDNPFPQRPRIYQRIFVVKAQMCMGQRQTQWFDGQAFGVDQVAPAIEAADQALVMQQVQRLAHRHAAGAEQLSQGRFQQNQPVTGCAVDDRFPQYLVDHRVTGCRSGHCFHRVLWSI